MVLRFDLNPVSSYYYSSPDVPLIILSMALSIILLGRGIGVREGGQGAVDPPPQIRADATFTRAKVYTFG